MELIHVSSGLDMIFHVVLFSALPEEGVAAAASVPAGMAVPNGGKKHFLETFLQLFSPALCYAFFLTIGLFSALPRPASAGMAVSCAGKKTFYSLFRKHCTVSFINHWIIFSPS